MYAETNILILSVAVIAYLYLIVLYSHIANVPKGLIIFETIENVFGHSFAAFTMNEQPVILPAVSLMLCVLSLMLLQKKK